MFPLGVLEDRKRRRAELQRMLADVESGKLRVGDSAATEEYKQQLRRSIELLDQIIELLDARRLKLGPEMC